MDGQSRGISSAHGPRWLSGDVHDGRGPARTAWAHWVHTTLRQACLAVKRGAMCVQRFNDSQCSAIHTTFRASLRSSSMREPRDPLLKVLIHWVFILTPTTYLHNCDDQTGRRATFLIHGLEVRWPDGHSLMIPPQVHLRRPCYDFYFL